MHAFIKDQLEKNPKGTRFIYLKNKNFIDSLFPSISNYSEKLWLIKNDINEIPKCICGMAKKFYKFSSGYFSTCGNEDCKLKSKVINTAKTNKELYGVECVFQSNEVKNKIKKTLKEKTGFDHNFKNPKVRDKAKQSLFLKHGVTSPLLSPEIKEKRSNTMKIKYGTDNWFSTELYKNKMIEIYGEDNSMKIDKFVNKVKNTQHTIKLEEILFRISSYGFVEYISYDQLNTRFTLKCKICENQFSIIRNGLSAYIRSGKNCCPTCNYSNRFRSRGEKEVFDWINSINTKYTITPNKKFGNLEVDIFIEELNIAIEFNGLYWHSERHKPSKYHQEKSETLEDKGINLLHIWEDDWILKSNIIKSIIESKINPIKIGARKTKVRVIDFNFAKEFHDNYHLDGNGIGSYHVGLFIEDEMISCATFGKSRYDKSYEWELVRYTTKETWSIIGGFSKLLYKFKEDNSPKSLMTYKKLDLGTTNIYEKLGFVKLKRTAPNFYWIVDDIRKNRQNYQKHKLQVEEGETAVDCMHRLGYFRIFDSGNDSFGICF